MAERNELIREADAAAQRNGHQLVPWSATTFHQWTRWEVEWHATHCTRCGLGHAVLRPVETGEWTEVGRTSRERCSEAEDNPVLCANCGCPDAHIGGGLLEEGEGVCSSACYDEHADKGCPLDHGAYRPCPHMTGTHHE